jgi:hypothetical protein
MKRRSIAVCSLIVLGSVALLAQTPSPSSKLVGVWKRNLAKSTYNTGTKPGPGSLSVYQWTARPDGFIIGTTVSINNEGIPSFNQSAAKYDGKDYPSYGSAALADFQVKGTKTGTLAFKPIDEYSVEIIGKGADGKVTNPNVKRIRTVSKDGKSMTDASKGTNAQGQNVGTVTFYDRVK